MSQVRLYLNPYVSFRWIKQWIGSERRIQYNIRYSEDLVLTGVSSLISMWRHSETKNNEGFGIVTVWGKLTVWGKARKSIHWIPNQQVSLNNLAQELRSAHVGAFSDLSPGEHIYIYIYIYLYYKRGGPILWNAWSPLPRLFA